MKTTLIIDDDVYIGNMLEETLVKEGYFVLRAYSGTEELLARIAVQFRKYHSSGHPRLCGELPEGSHQQSAQKASGTRRS